MLSASWEGTVGQLGPDKQPPSLERYWSVESIIEYGLLQDYRPASKGGVTAVTSSHNCSSKKGKWAGFVMEWQGQVSKFEDV